MKYTAIVNGKTYEVEIVRSGSGRTIGHSAPAAPAYVPVPAPVAASPAPSPAPVSAPAPAAPAPSPAPSAGDGSEIRSPMPGSVLNVFVNVGDAVSAGQSVVLLEAMKMEIEVRAEQAGTVSAVAVKKGDTVDSGTVLIQL